MLSEYFGHPSHFYEDRNTPHPVESAEDDSVTTPVLILSGTLQITWMITELTFFGLVVEHRFWTREGEGYRLVPTPATSRRFGAIFPWESGGEDDEDSPTD